MCNIPCGWDRGHLPKGSGPAGTSASKAHAACLPASRAVFLCAVGVALVSGLWTQKIWKVSFWDPGFCPL